MEPTRIETVRVDYRGNLFSTYYDSSNKFYYCPICGTDPDKPIFFALDDLIAHIRTHVKRRAGAPRVVPQPRPKQGAPE